MHKLSLACCPATPSFLLLLEECSVPVGCIQSLRIYGYCNSVAFWQQASRTFPQVRELNVCGAAAAAGVAEFLVALPHPVVAVLSRSIYVSHSMYVQVAALLPAAATHVTLKQLS